MVVMTDGINDVHPRDDEGLETAVGPVAQFLASASIPVITVGFGDVPDIGRDLKLLAQPGPENYHPAPDPNALVAAFQEARNSQVDRLRITFLPGDKSFTQLVRVRQFHAAINVSAGRQATGIVTWTPPPVVAPEDVATPEEAACLAGTESTWWSSPWFILTVLGALHYFFGTTVQRIIWGKQDAAEILLSRLRAPEEH